MPNVRGFKVKRLSVVLFMISIDLIWFVKDLPFNFNFNKLFGFLAKTAPGGNKIDCHEI